MNAEDPPGIELEFMRLAVEEARLSVPEDARIHPKVGVVIVKDGQVLAKAHRGEIRGSHAEYIALEQKLPDAPLTDAVVYTTLEPCTTRTHPKISCAERLVERKVGRVVIGILDPNSEISGKGQMRLQEASIATQFFPQALMREIEELNRDFWRAHRRRGSGPQVDEQFVRLNRDRPLDEWYMAINRIYWSRNSRENPVSIFAHLVEVIGGLSLVASQKQKGDLQPETFVPKALAWWMALCGAAHVRSVAEMLWAKFPGVCPYCHQCPHDTFECTIRKQRAQGLDWSALERIGLEKKRERPSALAEWQRMFCEIYPVQMTEPYGETFARFAEELGELAEAIRVFRESPQYFLNEAADVFAWLMHIQNLIDLNRRTSRVNVGTALAGEFCKTYPDLCVDCWKSPCRCDPVLPRTIGRIAHELPKSEGFFMTAVEAMERFQAEER